MSVQQKVLTACIGFVTIILLLGALVRQQAADTGRLTARIYDHAFAGISYADRMEADFPRIAAATHAGHAPPPAEYHRMLGELDGAIEQAASERTRSAGREVRALLVLLPDVPAAELPAWTARADLAVGTLARQFIAEALGVRDAADELGARSGRLMLYETMTAAFLALGVSVLLGRGLAQPLVKLVRIIGRLAAGELEHVVAPALERRGDEIGAVARATAVFREAMRQNARDGEERERERERTEAAKRQAATLELARMRLLSDISREIVIIHRDGVVLRINAAGGRMFGLPVDHAGEVRMADLVSPSDHQEITRCLRGEGDPGHGEIQLRAAGGALVPAEFTSDTIDYDGRPASVMALRDLSDHKRNEARIQHLAHHDALTDLPNRFLLRERLTKALDARVRSGLPLALLYIDLDDFKPVNDLLGHAAGDALLTQVAGRLLAELRPTDTVARVGGDEFVIVALVDRPESAAILAARLVEALAQPFYIGGEKAEIGASIGIALCPRDGDDQETLMHAADTALYRVKQSDRGTFRFFEPEMDEHLLARAQLERDLRLAIALGQLQLHYQPQVDCVSGEVEGFEALLRWFHPVRGVVPPLEFIAVAEETGLIAQIGQWVLETACEAAAAWTKPCRVAVNVSPVQFHQCDLLEIVAGSLARTGLPADRLEIEITESVLMSDPTRGADVLSALRELGVRVALDDFGTGYSSLSYLQAFKFDKLKIDRSFIMRLGQAEDSTIIVRTIIGLAHNLGLTIVAEGVETPEQLAIIRDFGCDQVQGYLLGRPAAMADVTELITVRAKALVMAYPADAIAAVSG